MRCARLRSILNVRRSVGLQPTRLRACLYRGVLRCLTRDPPSPFATADAQRRRVRGGKDHASTAEARTVLGAGCRCTNRRTARHPIAVPMVFAMTSDRVG